MVFVTLDMVAPFEELCIVWQLSQAATPPVWNANAAPLIPMVTSAATIKIKLIFNFMLILLSGLCSGNLAIREGPMVLRPHLAVSLPFSEDSRLVPAKPTPATPYNITACCFLQTAVVLL
jgi:hypothetical protein